MLLSDDQKSSSDTALSNEDFDKDLEKGDGTSRPTILGQLPTLREAGGGSRAGTLSLTRQAQPGARDRALRIERTNSINVATGPARPTAGAALPGIFRTLSIHVEETKGSKSKDHDDLANLDWHTLPSADVLARLGTSPSNGLDLAQVARRQQQHGMNAISPPPKQWGRKIISYVFGGFGSLLLVASIICFVAWRPLGDPNASVSPWGGSFLFFFSDSYVFRSFLPFPFPQPAAANLALAIVLLVVIFLTTFFNAWQDWSTSRVMASISSLVGSDAIVVRDGKTVKVPSVELVPGDVVKITLGCKLPADLRVISHSSDLKFDRSILTGESDAISAAVDSTDTNFLETRNIALQGTLCVSGSGRGVVVMTGDGTVFGRIAKLSSAGTGGRTTLEKEILRFVMMIASIAATLAILIVILWLAWLRPQYPSFITTSALLIDVVSVAVAMVPEGLPVCVTLSLTIIANAMRKSKVLCKSLATVETLGAVDVILSDKTGTLTTGKMTVKHLTVGDEQLTVSDACDLIEKDDRRAKLISDLAAIAAVCNDASFESEESELGDISKAKVNGDATDSGLLRFAQTCGSVMECRSMWSEVAKIAFNSKNKFAVKLMRPVDNAKRLAGLSTVSGVDLSAMVLFLKGAPDVLLPRCTTIVDSTGNVVPLDDDAITALVSAQERFASHGQRVLLLARRLVASTDIDKEAFLDTSSLDYVLMGINASLTIVGLVALEDPPKYDTAATVATCRRAGIRFFIVTGDFALTASAIGQQIGVLTSGDLHHLSDLPREMPYDAIKPYDPENDDPKALVLTGSDLLSMSESQWQQTLTYDEICFARTSPTQKLLITKRFQDAGSCVAVTGDGVNDSPALKQADVGVAMGGGSEVAMEAADLVLLQDFSAIVTAIQYGRMCFDNLKKVCLYLLPAGSFSELMPVVINVLFGVPQILSSFQMIIICVCTDVLPALSLINEKPEADLLLRRPRDRKKERLVDWRLLCHAYFFLGILESLCAMATSFYFGFVRRGIPWSALVFSYGGIDVDPDVLAEATARAQSIYFYCLVTMQWGNLMATRTRRLSIFQQLPIGNKRTQNLYLFPAMLCALGIATFFSYVNIFQNVLSTRPVAVENWFMPMSFGVGLLALDELRKLLVRKYPKGLIAQIAW